MRRRATPKSAHFRAKLVRWKTSKLIPSKSYNRQLWVPRVATTKVSTIWAELSRCKIYLGPATRKKMKSWNLKRLTRCLYRLSMVKCIAPAMTNSEVSLFLVKLNWQELLKTKRSRNVVSKNTTPTWQFHKSTMQLKLMLTAHKSRESGAYRLVARNRVASIWLWKIWSTSLFKSITRKEANCRARAY